MTTFGIAGVQMDVVAGGDNLARIASYVTHIKQRFPWIGMVLFSELCVHGPNPALAEPLPGPSERKLCEIAASAGLWLIPGSLFEQSQGKIFNTSPVIDPTGKVVTRFRKLFPFRPYEAGVEAGDQFSVFDVPGVGRFGLSICYDMWFPETTRSLVALGAEVILHPTLTDTIDREVELSIARASAATNQCYFFDMNGLGSGGCGRSTVIDCSGYVLHESDTVGQIVPVEVDFDRIRRERERGLRGLGQPLKSFRDRKVDFDVYRTRANTNDYLGSLGPLALPRRPSS
jgi:deaminated glutathione amidase